MKAPTERFTDRVRDYEKYRPTYPEAVLECLQTVCGVREGSTVADIGSGTGIFTELLLQSGCQVFAVEPNDEMRLAAENRLRSRPGFHSVSGTAERSGLESASIDVITAAQSFHWFRRQEAQREFRRILKPTGWIALVWNQRRTDSPFQIAYDALLHEHVPEYKTVNHRNVDRVTIEAFLDGSESRRFTFENSQHFDFEGLTGRLRSSSYSPLPDEPHSAELIEGLERIFHEFAVAEQVVFQYETELHIGTLRKC